MKSNIDKVVQIAVSGIVKAPRDPYKFSTDYKGNSFMLPATGGITYNVRLGDSCYGWAADHIEPGASTFNDRPDEGGAYSALSCMGNEVRVLTGDAKGAIGYVCGQHGGVEHIMVNFHPDDLEKLAINDRIQIKTCGLGFKLIEWPGVEIHNIDPRLFLNIGITEKDGKLEVPVAGVIPASLIGSGWGDTDKIRGRDCDLTTSDWESIVENDLQDLKLGDFVLIKDMYSGFGRSLVRGSATVGVIIHGDSPLPGHGPGIATFMTSIDPVITFRKDPDANIAKYHDKAFGPLVPLK